LLLSTKVTGMPSGPGERYDFFLSRRGSVATIAREVADVLTEKGYRVLVQDYDIPFGASFVEAMHEAIINSRDLIILRRLSRAVVRSGAVVVIPDGSEGPREDDF
jgi:hypothetical protein